MDIFFVEKTHQKTGVALDDHSRSSIMILDKSTRQAGPVAGISESKLSNPERMFFSPA